MRRLILMRHAKSSWADAGQRDIDRPLNARGRRSATLIGTWLRDAGHLPDRALVSEARRTRETWAGMVAVFGDRPATFLPSLYHADAASILEIIKAAPETQTLLILGHQPAIGHAARLLLAVPPEAVEFDHYPTASTTVMDFDIETWEAAEWGDGDLCGFTVPRALEDQPHTGAG